MREEKIKQLSIVKEFSNYFLRRGKKVLKLKNSEFKSFSVDFFGDSERIWIWFFGKDSNVIARVQFTFDGKRYGDLLDNRKSEPEAENFTQGKPEDA